MKPLSPAQDKAEQILADKKAPETQDAEQGADNVDTRLLPRGAKSGPLSEMIPVFIDVETFMSEDVSLDDMTLRQYLAESYLTSIAVAIGETDPVETFFTPRNPGPAGSRLVTAELQQVLQYLAVQRNYVFVAHNAAFDMRVIRAFLGVPHPINVWCTMEGAMGAWPELPGGFGLANIAKRLRLPSDRCKLELDLLRLQRLIEKCPLAVSKADELVVSQMKTILKVDGIPWPKDDVITKELCLIVLAIYNRRDVEAMRDIFLLQAARIHPLEQGVALRTHHQRRHHFLVDNSRLDEFVEKMDQNAAYAEKEVEAMVGTGDLRAIFNRENDGKMLTSIRYQRLKKIVNEKLANEEFESTSLKKLSPLQLARNPKVYELLQQTTRAGKMMSHKRRAKVFHGVSEVDVELGFARAHTGRFSSPSVGKGLNLHNCVSGSSWILTARGFIPILHLQKGDLLWDGTEFVAFAETTYEGERTTEKVGLAEVTSEHPVWDGTQMTPAGELTHYQRARVVAAGFSSMLLALLTMPSGAAVLDAAMKLSAWFSTSRSRLAAVVAQTDAALASTISGSLTSSCASSASGTTTCATGSTASDTPVTRLSRVADMALACVELGEETSGPSSSTASRFLAGMTELSNWIERTIASDTNRVTSALLTAELMSATDATLSGLRMEKHWSTTVGDSVSGMPPGTVVSSSAVFDIRGVGHRARFWCSGAVSANCPKHDKAIAEPVRKLFRMPPELCLVRGDLANVEFRVEGYLTGATNVLKMFDPKQGGSIYTDPYSASWKTMTSMLVTKKDPARQVAKAAVLGLGFCMSPAGYAKVLLVVLADKKSGVTEAALREIIIKNNWRMPDNDRVKKIMTMLGCSQIVALAAFHIHKLFNDAYPEFRRTAYWLVRAIERVAAANPDRDNARRVLDNMYTATDAPNRDLIGLEIDDDPLPLHASVRAICGPWARTVCWREPYMRKTDFNASDTEKKLTIRKATGEYKPFTPQLAIENITQAAARNALCMGVEHLEKLGFLDVIHVHDEIMILCKRERNAVLAARDALLQVFGPGHTMPYAWSILVKPEEVTLTESLYEDENDVAVKIKNKEGLEVPGPDRWGRIERNEPGCLLNLP